MALQVVLVILAALLQGTNIISLFGTKPNLVLLILIPLIFVVNNRLAYVVLVLIAGLFLKTVPGIDWQIGLFILVVLVAYFLSKFLPWQSFFNNLVLLAGATIILSLPDFFGIELVYNVILGTGFYYILKKYYA